MVGMAAGNVLPAFRRRRRRHKEDKGLPPDSEIIRLAHVYLEHQRKLWSELMDAGILPEATPEVLNEMVQDFKDRHRNGKAAVHLPAALLALHIKLAGDYNRFSCDKSSPNSAIDQMVNCLRRAREEGEFIPWQYVFCDYSVSGLDSARQGYVSYKSVLESSEHQIRTTYIDDFTRASRQDLEWWSLAYRSRKLKKAMIGASDGFDLRKEDWELKIAIYGILSRLFMKSLREKVRRGMKGGHRRRTCLGKPPFGFTRQEQVDNNGQVIRNQDGGPVYVLCWDPDNVCHVKRAFEMFWVEKWSVARIRAHFNEQCIAGWNGWTDGGIKKILSNPAYIGVFVWNKFHTDFDPEEEKYTRIKNPRKEWEVWFDRSLAVIPMDWYRGTRRRLDEMRRASPLTGRKRSRNQISANTLVSGTMFCDYCGSELKLLRSTGKYKQLGCLNGACKKHGCRLTSSKSVRTLEACLLKYLTEGLFTDARLDALIEPSNKYIEEERQRPRTDTAVLRSEAKKTTAKIARQLRELEEEERDTVRKAIRGRINELQASLDRINAELASIARREAQPPPPLDRERIRGYLADIRSLLNGSTAAAADAIREITGPIRVRQEPIPGRVRGARWVAKFSPQFLQFLAKYATERDYPDSCTLEYLSTRIWTIPESQTVQIYNVPIYEELAAEFREMHQAGMSIQAMATQKGMAWPQANECLTFALTGVRPSWKAKGELKGTNSKKQRYLEISGEVARRCDLESQTFAAIARELKVAEQTVRRAYDAAHPELVAAAQRAGQTPDRPRNPNIPKAVLDSVDEMIKAGVRDVKLIVAETGCGEGTVRRKMSVLGIRLRNAALKPKVPKKPKIKPESYTGDVVKMHDLEGLSFSEISRRLKICDRTVRKAYDLGRPDIIAAAVASGVPPQRSNRSRLSSEEKAMIHTLIRSGQSTTTIVATTGASRTTVNRERLK
jgi:hypothetical protein